MVDKFVVLSADTKEDMPTLALTPSWMDQFDITQGNASELRNKNRFGYIQ